MDDEPPAITVLEKFVGMTDSLKLSGSCSNAIEALKWLKKEPVDLLFLDIQMPQLSGTSFLKTLSHPPKVIFTTAYKEYAMEAFDLDAVDYLLKPISLERFLKAVNKLTQGEPRQQEQASVPEKSGFVYFRVQRKMVKVYLDDIVYIESIKDYIKVYRESGPALIVKQSITTLEAMLPVSIFVRIHRSYIVSLQKITAFTAQDVEVGSTEIPIGRSYSGVLKHLM